MNDGEREWERKKEWQEKKEERLEIFWDNI